MLVRHDGWLLHSALGQLGRCNVLLVCIRSRYVLLLAALTIDIQQEGIVMRDYDLASPRHLASRALSAKARLVQTWLAIWLAFLACAVQATPPPESVGEGFGAPTAVSASTSTPAAEGTTATTQEAPLTTAQKIEALLAETPELEEYETGKRCLRRNQVRRFEVLDASLLLLHGRKGKFWISQFPRKCIGLRRNMPLVMEVRGSQLCSNDRFYGRQPWERFDGLGARSGNLGSVQCLFSTFEAVSQEQADMIREAAKNGAFR